MVREMWPETYKLNVSREIADKLKIYHALLLKWQKAINLISPKSVDDAWVRHFLDSAQVERHVSRESLTVADLGCGGGFPGLVLAIMRPDLKIHLVESDERKCQFLRTVSRETNVNVMVHNSRIESCIDEVKPDFVMARALADLSALLGYVDVWSQGNCDLECIFLKGAQLEKEIEEAQKIFTFEFDKFPSITDPHAALIHIRNISRNLC